MAMPPQSQTPAQGAPASGGNPLELVTEAATLLGKAYEAMQSAEGVSPQDKQKLFALAKATQVFLQQVGSGSGPAQPAQPGARGAVPMEAGANPNARPAL